jgi:hypothetical protein
MLAIAKRESGFNPERVSPKGAIGVMQLMPNTAKDFGVDPRDALQNIDGATRFMVSLLSQFKGDLPKALAAYNAGPESVKKYHGIPPFSETQHYVPEVLRLKRQYDQQLAPSAPDAPGQRNPSGAQIIIPMAYESPGVQPSISMQDLSMVIAGIGQPDSKVPAWFNTLPRWMSESPKWYDVLPAWFHERSVDPDVRPAHIAKAATYLLPAREPNPSARVDFQRPPIAVLSGQQGPKVDFNGGVHISVTISQPGADAYAIERAVHAGVRSGLSDQIQGDLLFSQS